MDNTYKLTEQGYQKLKQELETLKDVDRKQNLEALKEARAQGDLSENADYDAARDEQARIEARIKEIENILKHSEIISNTNNSKTISIGKTVSIRFLSNDSIREFTIVGHLEANPLQGKISNESPIGKALIGRRRGQTIQYKAETGTEISVEVLDIK
ncbi:MAG: transcription elongation factor GreA [Candidatus Izemoplasmatales bacterium]|jgi:transcription elongation factor GreA|nr:transcription elongation factor GreA [Candidatus Izemoplasmatales bacterium]NLF49314.1 transcription elongation factor GreA [Acholeplasmataceae bacterium]MDD4354271.1 transcription elongation factor GreA [Candidatus Izemoplasmatales bacterium]MDD4987275.1 transcription elongation factor GreA [Candidatus Izemoplasmatales bacterium]MDD5601500.1 transcription elongation factor GreA [Candidatus Izemoplasmatales bacterium]